MAEQLVINSISLNHSTGAWKCASLAPLWVPSDYRAGNVVIPGASGRRAYAYRIDEGRYSIQMFISGRVDFNGNTYTTATYATGLQLNIAHLNTNLLTPPTAPTSTFSSTLTLPNASTRTASVQVVGLNIEASPAPLLRAVLELVVPAGRYA